MDLTPVVCTLLPFENKLDSRAPNGVLLPTPNVAPVLTGHPASLSYIGAGPHTFSFAPYASDANGDTITYSLPATRTGITINGTTGVLTITGAQGTEGNITVRVSDGLLTTDYTVSVVVTVEGSGGSAFPAQGAVSYTPHRREVRGPGNETIAGTPRAAGVVYTAGQSAPNTVTIRRVTGTDTATLTSSFLSALAAHDSGGGPTLVVFDNSGTIDLGGANQVIDVPNIWIAGETAPNPGIQIVKGKLSFRATDAVMTHVTVRGLSTTTEQDACEAGAKTSDVGDPAQQRVVFDHLTVMWGGDETLSFYDRLDKVTVSNCIIAEGCAYYNNGSGLLHHQYGTLIPSPSQEHLLYANLFHSNKARNPLVRSLQFAFVNNLTHNFQETGLDISAANKAPDTGQAQFNSVAGNLWTSGPNTSNKPIRSAATPVAASRVYWNDNLWNNSGVLNRSTSALSSWTFTQESSPTFWPTGLVALDVDSLEDALLARVGSRPASRDAVTTRIISEVSARTGSGKVFNGPTTGSAAMSPTTLLTTGDIPTYAFTSRVFPSSPSSGGAWTDIVLCSDGLYRSKLEKEVHDLEDLIL